MLSGAKGSTFGGSLFTLTDAGKSKLIYSFQPYAAIFDLLQGTDHTFFGAGFVSTTQYTFYFSLLPSGKDEQESVPPNNWQGGAEGIVTPGDIYDIVGRVAVGGSITFAFARIDQRRKVTILHEFSAKDGAPTGPNLVRGADGNFYSVGNQQRGGVSPGFIFRFTPRGDYSRLLAFPSFPSGPFQTPLLAASDGNLYGLFADGGVNQTGEIYQATLPGQLQAVASFPPKGSGMREPQTFVEASDGNLYGTTNNDDVFRFNLATHELTSAYHMNRYGSQGKCPCKLIQGMDGKIYGVTPTGGNAPSIGAVFSIDFGLPKPRPVVSEVVPASSAVGQKVLLWGKYLLKPSAVSFNGVAATDVTPTSIQSVWATVPAGATTGPITITTANGSFTTQQNFTVQ